MNRESRIPSDLVARARAGDVTAFDALYLSCQAGIYSFIRSQVREEELAADLTQQTFVRAWESLPRLKEAGAFLGWLHRIAANLVRDEVKSGRARLELTTSDLPDDREFAPSTDPGPEEAAISADLKDAVWAAISELSADQRGVVVMHHLEGLSVSEIAHALTVRPGTVMSRLARAREALRQRLSSYLEEPDDKL